jgi:hypothetical protein
VGKERVREIRLMAMAALQNDTEEFGAWRCYAELKHLFRKSHQVLHLEALILTCVAGRIRSARVVRALKNLRQVRTKSGELEKFLAFERLVTTSLGEQKLTNHGFNATTFGDVGHDEIWTRISDHISVLKDKGYQAFLNSGTLLGVTRDKRLIDHDDDVDLALILRATNTQDAAREWKELKAVLIEQEIFDKKNFKNPAIYKLLPIGTCQIDLFPAWFEDSKAYVYPHTFASLEEKDVRPLAPCKVSGNLVPARPEKMLAVNYGKSWDKPDPYFKFPWNARNVQFKTFLDALQ